MPRSTLALCLLAAPLAVCAQLDDERFVLRTATEAELPALRDSVATGTFHGIAWAQLQARWADRGVAAPTAPSHPPIPHHLTPAARGSRAVVGALPPGLAARHAHDIPQVAARHEIGPCGRVMSCRCRTR